MGIGIADSKRDGLADVFVAHDTAQNFLYLNLGEGRFEEVSLQYGVAYNPSAARVSGMGCDAKDFDNDGWKDIHSANGDVDYLGQNAAQHDTMLRNLSGTRFVDVSESLGTDFLHVGYQRGSAFGDLNDDGFVDIVVTSLNESPRILLNSADNGGHWLLVSLKGKKSNRDAIEAQIKLVTDPVRPL